MDCAFSYVESKQTSNKGKAMPIPRRFTLLSKNLFKVLPVVGLFVFVLSAVLGAAVGQPDGLRLVDEQCLKCHADYQGRDNVLAGTVVSHSGRSKSLMVQVDHERHVITYTDDTRMFLDGRLEEQVPVTVALQASGQALVADEIRSMPPIYIPDEEYITTDELYSLIAAGPEAAGYALFDVRPASRYAEGHLPTSLSLPLDQMTELRNSLPDDPNTLLIFYCGGEHCTLSLMAAQIAGDWGYTNIRVYQDGTPDWLNQGNVLLSTRDFVLERRQQIVLLDLRGQDSAAQGHIPGAVAVMPGDLQWLRDQFPADQRAYVVLYGNDDNWSQLAPLARTIHAWGYTRVSVLDGGFSSWRQAGFPENTIPVSTRIAYVHQPLPGEVSKEEFTRLVRDLPADKLILDVRTPAEMSAGSLPLAVKIPLDELAVRINEIPPNREVIVHCATGMRAEIGHAILSRFGLQSRFLNDSVDIIGSKVYLGTSIALDDAAEDEVLAGLDPSLVKIQVASTDAALSAKMLRFGKVEFDRGRYAAAKAYFWRAILADPTSRDAWRHYDMSVVSTLADTVQRFPAMLGAPDALLEDAAPQGMQGLPGGLTPTPPSGRSDEGC